MQDQIVHKKLKVLVTALDWGLGHTTRCVPIIKALLNNNVEVILAGNQVQKHILLTEFPQCKFLDIEGYNIQYSSSSVMFAWKIFTQIPKILRAIKNEHHWLQKIIIKENINAVVSDNRFGMYSKNAATVFITHQLLIKNKSAWVERWLQKINYSYINKYDACWIPDLPAKFHLSGVLGHPHKMPKIGYKYVGLLSRLEKKEIEHDGSIVFLLSGPEPQRTLLEEKIIASFINVIDKKLILVRGVDTPFVNHIINHQIIVHNYVSSNELNKILNTAELVICRSGYSSVMDLAVLNKKAVFIPTPGQTEQEFLAKYLEDTGFAPYLSQENFDIQKAINLYKKFSYKTKIKNEELLNETIKNWIHRLS